MMAYSQRFVVSVLVDGRVQKELNDGTVELPFGSEYAIRFRNKHRDRRAVVKLYIDGEEQSKNGYVIPPNGYADIERNSHTPQKFLFVAPDSADAQDFGKDPENKERLNGVIEARFYLEKVRPVVKEVHHHHDYYHPAPRPWPWRRYIHHHYHPQHPSHPKDSSWIECSKDGGSPDMDMTYTCSVDSTPVSSTSPEPKMECKSQPFNKSSLFFHETKEDRQTEVTPGVTVEGSYSTQRFRAVDIDLEDQFTVIKVLLKGYQDEDTVEEVASANPKVSGGEDTYCSNCGAKRKPPKANFCHVCAHKY